MSAAKIQCPYCCDVTTKFLTTADCRQHAHEEHEDEIAEPLGPGFFLEDYLAEEELFFELKARLEGHDEDIAAAEAAVRGKLIDKRREKLMVLRLAISLWPCRHEGEGEAEAEEINLSSCCEARRRFGEFMNILCDAYEIGDCDADESE